MSTSRRDFLKASLSTSTLLALAPTVPTFLSRSARAGSLRRDADDTILVVVQLAGGNDGLNSVIPYEDDEYVRARPTLRMTPQEVRKIDSEFGFHPKMGAFLRLLKEGHLSVLHGIGYPNPLGGHAESMRVWQSAALNAERSVVPSYKSFDDCMLGDMPGDEGGAAHRSKVIQAAELPRSADEPLLDFLQQSTLATYAANKRMEAVARSQTAARPGAYPKIQLAQNFRTISQLIRADLGIRIFYAGFGGAEPGGFDNHANQRGNHGALLYQLAESFAAFLDDLARDNLLDRVLVMTFSEFGRTVKENGRHGTGHGSAAPMFLAGGRVKGGLVGEHPPLTGELENGGQKHHTDFRRVYATLLESWLGFDSLPVLGKQYEPLDCLDV